LTFYCKILIFISLSLFPFFLSGQWAATVGGPEGDEIVDVKSSDSQLFTAGYYQQTLGLDSSKGGVDAFLKAYTLDGFPVWQYVIGGENNDYLTAIEPVLNQYIYAAGTFNGSLEFGDNDTTLYSLNKAVFICKLTQNGQFIWAKCFRGSSLVTLEDFVIDHQQKLYLCGAFQDSFLVNNPNVLVGGVTLKPYVLCLEEDAPVLWSASPILSSAAASANCIGLDSNGYVYVAGEFNKRLTWLQDTFQAHPIFPDIFLIRLDSMGLLSWDKQFEGAYNNEVSCLQYYNNKLYMGGQFKGNLFLDTILLSTAFRNYDAFVAQLDNNGAVQWATQSISPTDCILQDLTFYQNQLLVAGYFLDSFSWKNQTLQAEDQIDAFIFVLDIATDQYVVQQLGGDGYDLLNSIVCLDNGTVLTGGGFQQNINLNDTVLLSTGFSDAFLASFAPFVLSLDKTTATISENSTGLVYPNPFYQTIYLRCEACQDLKWFLYNNQGVLLSIGQQQQINTENLPSGHYFLKVIFNKQQQVLSIIRR
jgi:hypothetical protein